MSDMIQHFVKYVQIALFFPVHAREWLAPAATLWAAKSLLEGYSCFVFSYHYFESGYGTDSAITALLNTAGNLLIQS